MLSKGRHPNGMGPVCVLRLASRPNSYHPNLINALPIELQPHNHDRAVCLQVCCIDHQRISLAALIRQLDKHPGKNAFLVPGYACGNDPCTDIVLAAPIDVPPPRRCAASLSYNPMQNLT